MTNGVERRYSIKPSDIDASKHLFEAFDHTETEISAGYIIRMLQERDSWEPFTQEEIEEFYNLSGYEGFTFNALIDPVRERLFGGGIYQVGGGYIVRRDDGRYEVTDEFVKRAFQSSLKQV